MKSKKKKVYRALNYFEHFLVFVFAVSDCTFVSVFASSVGVSAGILSSAVELKNCAITVGIKKYKSIIKKRRKTMIK